MIKSLLVLLTAGGLAWSAWRAPGPPTCPPDYGFQVSHHGRGITAEPVHVRSWERNILVHLDFKGCEADRSAGSLRLWVVGAGLPEAYPRRNYEFRGSTGSVQCPVPIPAQLPCRVVICAEDNRGHRETRSFTIAQ